MNVGALKGKRVECRLTQADVAKKLGTAPKTVCIKENSSICKFSVGEIIKLVQIYHLNIKEVNLIFFDNKLPNGKL